MFETDAGDPTPATGGSRSGWHRTSSSVGRGRLDCYDGGVAAGRTLAKRSRSASSNGRGWRRAGRRPAGGAQDRVVAAPHQADEHLGDDGAADRAEAVAAVVLGLGQHVVPERRAVRKPRVWSTPACVVLAAAASISAGVRRAGRGGSRRPGRSACAAGSRAAGCAPPGGAVARRGRLLLVFADWRWNRARPAWCRSGGPC